MQKILEVKHLSASYKRGKEHQEVLKDISFDLMENEILGLVGESGCGKSTLSKAILGFVKDVSGEIVHHTKHPQMIFQDPLSSLNPAKTIGWIVEEPLRIQKMCTPQERKEKVRDMLQKVGLDDDVLERYPIELSGGQRQRVAIAAALIGGARFLIADEPVSALDVTIQRQIMELLVKMQEEMGLSYLFISHDLNVIYQMCDRVMIMRDGVIIEEQETEELFQNPREEYTRQLLHATIQL